MEYKRAPFQQRDLEFFKGKNASANFSAMGCYKTSTAQFLAQDLGAERILIVTSKTGKTTYFQTLPHILGGIPQFNIQAQDLPVQLGYTGKRRQRSAGVFLAHYNLFTRKSAVSKAIRSCDFDLVVLDESHRVKNHKAQCSHELHYLRADVKHIMTGSPFTNNPSDLWSQARAIAPKDTPLPGYWTFANYFCSWDQDLLARGFRKCVGTRHAEELKQWLSSFAIWRTIEDVFPDLPPKVKYEYKVDLNVTQRRIYNEIKAELMSLDEQGVPFHSPNVLSALSRLRQITSATPKVNGRYWLEKEERWVYDIELTEPSAKLDALMDVIAETSEPLVVFYTHRDVGKLLNARLEKKGISYVNMLQKHDDTARWRLIEAFQNGEAKVFHSTIALGSESVTLTNARSVVFIDRAWTPAANNQAEARVHRPGQRYPTNIVDIFGKGTTDGYVRGVVKNKQSWFDEIFSREMEDSMWTASV